MTQHFQYGEEILTPAAALELAAGDRGGTLSGRAREAVERSRRQVERIVASGEVVYGVTTGFGLLCDTVISEEQTRLLQSNILKSHSVGMGSPVPDEVSRLMLVLKLQALSYGRSGVDPATLDRILQLLERGVAPVVPCQGSLGASGDLAPLAHLFLPLIGLGQVVLDGRQMPASEALEQLGLQPLELGPKEGLALINGTQFIVAWAVRALTRMANLLDAADLIGAMSLEALLGSTRPFLRELHELRPYRGSRLVARRLRLLLESSEILASHQDCDRVQDPYSLRCMPQVHGASRNAWLHLKEMLMVEMNAVTDNPIILPDGESISGGNFHGQPMALPLDYAVVAASEIGNISDRRTYQLLDGAARDLPRLLMQDVGINSGYMMPQYTSAAVASENKGLCFPASADSIPSSLGQEDHVSMGAISARKLDQVCGNVEKILAVELTCAAQAFDFRRPLASGPVLEACHELVRRHIDHADRDRVFAHDLEAARQLIAGGDLVARSRQAAAAHGIDLDGDEAEAFALA
jgi:histidine ammonia-lyase